MRQIKLIIVAIMLPISLFASTSSVDGKITEVDNLDQQLQTVVNFQNMSLEAVLNEFDVVVDTIVEQKEKPSYEVAGWSDAQWKHWKCIHGPPVLGGDRNSYCRNKAYLEWRGSRSDGGLSVNLDYLLAK